MDREERPGGPEVNSGQTPEEPAIEKGRTNRNGSSGAKAGSWATSEGVKKNLASELLVLVEPNCHRLVNYLRSDRYDMAQCIQPAEARQVFY